MEKHDVIIVGAGPGGLTAAKELAKKDRDVLVLERRPEDRIGDKVCTAGIPIHLIDELHLPESVYIGTEVPLKFYIRDRVLRPELSGNKRMGFFDRIKLGQHQLKEAKRFGADVRGQSSVSEIKMRDKIVILKDGKEIGYNKLIAAYGSNIRLMKSMGLSSIAGIGYQYLLPDEKCKECNIYFDFDKIGPYYMWTNPHGDGKRRNDIMEFGDAYMVNPQLNWENWKSGAERKRYFEKYMEEKTGIELKKRYVIKKAAPSNLAWNWFNRGDVYLIGEVGSFINTLTGMGVYQSIKSGEVAAKAILEEPYKKALKEVSRHRQVGASYLFGAGLSEGKLNPKYLAKMWGWLEGHYYGHRALSGANHIAAKLLRYDPKMCSFLYNSFLWAPTTVSSWETFEKFIQMWWYGRVI